MFYELLDKLVDWPYRNREPVLCVDFDGVLHSYKSGWKGPRCIPDPPVFDAISWLRDVCSVEQFRVCIFSSRNRYFGGRRAMKKWLIKHGLPPHIVHCFLEFPLYKPPAQIILDDRAITFTGEFPSIQTLVDFKPWNKVKITSENG